MLETLQAAPRAALGSWPTPLQRFTGKKGSLWIKRDDLSGFGRGGSKTRKIELLIGHLLARRCDTLITVAGNVTNLAYDLIPALDRYGIELRLFIVDSPHAPLEERERLFAPIRSRLTLLDGNGFLPAVRAYLAARREGRRPFLLLPGASHPSGVIGNALGFVEMVEQLQNSGEALPRRVFVTAATGTTVAGFLLAEHWLRTSGTPPIEVIGVQAHPGPMATMVRALVRWTERSIQTPLVLPLDRIRITRDALCGGFGRFSPQLADLCERVEQESGLQIDPIFGGKTWSILEQAGFDVPTLYWHCGYTPEWKLIAA